jgi:predicted  nucleic acid-binding Zn-ribbon protein
MALQEARSRLDKQAIETYSHEIRNIRKRIADLRADLAQLATERSHMVDLLEHSKYLVKRHERAIADQDRRMECLREEILRLGGLPGRGTMTSFGNAHDENISH